MDTETLVALLTVLTSLLVIVIGGVGFLVYQVKKRTDDRIDALNGILDSLDERLIHKFTAMDRKTEEIQNSVGKVDQKAERERQDREETANNLFRKVDEVLEKLDSQLKDTEGRLKDLQTGQEEIIAGLRSNLESTLKEIEQRQQDIALRQDQDRDSLGAFRASVEDVRRENSVQLGLSHLRSNRFESAAQVFDALLQQSPSDRQFRLLAVESRLKNRDFVGARALSEAGLETHPGDADLMVSLAIALRELKDRGERARLLAEGLVRTPDHVGLRFERGLLHAELGRWEQSIQDLESLVQGGTESAQIRYNLGIGHVSLGNIPAAIAEFRRSLALDPTSTECNHALGLALLQSGRYREAVDFLERAREFQPQDTVIRLDLAMALRLANMPDESLRECAIARHLAPGEIRIGLEEALCHYAMADFNEALDCLTILLDQSPENTRGRKLRAEILGELDRMHEAVEEWGRLAQLNPEDAMFQAQLGMALKKAGQPAAALGCLEVAARMAPDSPSVQLAFAKEALAQQRFDLVQEVVEQTYPTVQSPESRLQMLEFRLLVILKSGGFTPLILLLDDIEAALNEHPEVIPVSRDIDLDEETVQLLDLSPDATKIYRGLQDLFEGSIGFKDFDELITAVMRAQLPTPPRPPEPIAADSGNGQPATESPVEPPARIPEEPVPVVQEVPIVEEVPFDMFGEGETPALPAPIAILASEPESIEPPPIVEESNEPTEAPPGETELVELQEVIEITEEIVEEATTSEEVTHGEAAPPKRKRAKKSKGKH